MGTTTPIQAHELVSDIEYSDAGDTFIQCIEVQSSTECQKT